MLIYRYSNDGFTSQRQDHHLSQLEYELSDEKFYSEIFPILPDHLRRDVEENHRALTEFYSPEGAGSIADIEYGIWVFTRPRFDRVSLNHLDIVPPRWSAEIPDDTIVYDVNLRYTMPISDPRASACGCFLPAKEIKKISNISRYEDTEYEGRSLEALKREEDAMYDWDGMW